MRMGLATKLVAMATSIERLQNGQSTVNRSSSTNPENFDDLYPRLIHPSLDRLHSPPQTTSRSNRPFFHNTPTRQTDRQADRPTDRWARRQFCSNTHLHFIDCIATRLTIQKKQKQTYSRHAWRAKRFYNYEYVAELSV